MTWRELLEAIKELDESELDNNVTVFMKNKFYPIETNNVEDVCDVGEFVGNKKFQELVNSEFCLSIPKKGN